MITYLINAPGDVEVKMYSTKRTEIYILYDTEVPKVLSASTETQM